MRGYRVGRLLSNGSETIVCASSYVRVCAHAHVGAVRDQKIVTAADAGRRGVGVVGASFV